METKICTKCHKEYPATTEYFYKCSWGKNGLNSSCKKCRIAASKEYRHTPEGAKNRYLQRVRWSIKYPEKHKYLSRKNKLNAVRDLKDYYIACKLNMSVKDLTPEIIETQRNIIKIKRLCKSKTQMS